MSSMNDVVIPHTPRPKKSTEIRHCFVKWFGQVEMAGYVADLIQSEANRRRIAPNELISDVLYYVATGNLFEAVIDSEPLNPPPPRRRVRRDAPSHQKSD